MTESSAFFSFKVELLLFYIFKLKVKILKSVALLSCHRNKPESEWTSSVVFILLRTSIKTAVYAIRYSILRRQDVSKR